jgi:zinc protease
MKKILLLFLTVLLILVADSSLAQERFRKEAPPPDPLPQLNLPQVLRNTLVNGLELMAVRIENAPIMELRMIIGDGESSSPEDLPGLATFTANMLDKGAGTFTSSQIEEQIESIGGSFSVEVFSDYSLFSFSFLEEHLDEALDLMSKMILQPIISKLEIDSVKRTMYYDHIQRYSFPEALGKKLLYQILFQNHPFQKITFNEEVIKNFNREALLAFLDKFYRPNNARILLFGNVNLDTASRKISHYFKDWQNKEIEKTFIPPPVPNDKLRICFIDLPQAKNATLFLGNTIPFDDQNDLFSFLVFNQLLGGTTNSRLLMNLRETNKRNVFWAFSEVEFFRNFGVFFVRSMIQPDAIYQSVSDILEEIRKAKQAPLPISDIEQAKSYLINHFPLTIRNVNEIASKVSEKEVYNRGDEFWNEYYESVSLVNAADVFKSLANTSILQPIVIIVGNEDTLIDQLSEFDEVEFYDKNGISQYSLKERRE